MREQRERLVYSCRSPLQVCDRRGHSPPYRALRRQRGARAGAGPKPSDRAADGRPRGSRPGGRACAHCTSRLIGPGSRFSWRAWPSRSAARQLAGCCGCARAMGRARPRA